MWAVLSFLPVLRLWKGKIVTFHWGLLTDPSLIKWSRLAHQKLIKLISLPSDQIRSVAQPCPTLWDPMNRSTPGLHVHHQLPEFTQTHAHQVGDAIQPSPPLLSPSPHAPNPFQHQSLFQWVNSSHEVAKQGNTNQNLNEISPHTCQYSYYQKDNK